MRDIDATELVLGDVHIKLAPRRPEASKGESTVSDPDERAELTAEEREQEKRSADEREHYKYWRRLTRSSGAPIPPFRPRTS